MGLENCLKIESWPTTSHHYHRMIEIEASLAICGGINLSTSRGRLDFRCYNGFLHFAD